MTRNALRQRVAKALGSRELLWSGIRGDDAESLSDLPQFSGSFSIFGAYERRPLKYSLAYEDITGHRVDPESWDIDAHLGEDATKEFRWSLLRAMSGPTALVPYRPSAFQSAIAFARQDRCRYLGQFGALQSAFEHKPWVETGVRGLGLQVIEWRYIADEEQRDAERLLADGPVMLRRSRTSGGEGFVRVDSMEQLAGSWFWDDESFVSVARYHADGIPLNVGATVWDDGVTVHLPSVQLIGIPSCTNRPFGYCGNDFSAVSDLGPELIAQIERATRRIGYWLNRYGYRGAFGVDYLYVDGRLLFTEVNPRFQGSTRPSSLLSVHLDEPCLLLEHVAAHLGLEAPVQRPLATRISEAPTLSQVVMHWTGESTSLIDPERLRDDVCAAAPTARMDSALPRGVTVETGATVARFTIERSVTRTGFDLDPDLESIFSSHNAASLPERT